MKFKLHHRSSKSQQQRDHDDVVQEEANGDEFEVVPPQEPMSSRDNNYNHSRLNRRRTQGLGGESMPSDATSRAADDHNNTSHNYDQHDSSHPPTKLTKQRFSMRRMLSGKNGLNIAKNHRGEGGEQGRTGVPFSPAHSSSTSTSASSTITTSPTNNSKNHALTFMKRLKKKTSDLFQLDESGAERISVGDEYAIVSIQPKMKSRDEKFMSIGDGGGGNTPVVAMSKSRSLPAAAGGAVNTATADTSNGQMQQEQKQEQLKKQKFSIVRAFSSRRS